MIVRKNYLHYNSKIGKKSIDNIRTDYGFGDGVKGRGYNLHHRYTGRECIMNLFTQWLETYYEELEPLEFYRLLFPEGALDREGKKTKGKYNAIAISITKEMKENGKPKVKKYVVSDGLQGIEQCMATDDFCLLSPISYAGNRNLAKYGRALYGFIIDLDKIRISTDGKRPAGLVDLWYVHIDMLNRVPKPTAIVSSGTGLHLYYILEKPIPLFPNTVEQLQKYKHRLTELVWNEGVVDISSNADIQYQGIYQGFRVVGTVTKTGSRARAFETGEKVTMEYMNGFVEEHYRVTDFKYKSATSLDEAKELYPEWYEQRIVKNVPPKAWHINRSLYEWWKKKVIREVKVGHRYNCMMILVVFAMKCSFYDEKKNPNPITYEELKEDCLLLFDYFETLTKEENNHFTTADLLDALETYKHGYIHYPRKAIEYRSGISVPPNKRNYRPQNQHLKIARYTLEVMSEAKGKALQGRPKGSGTKQRIVEEWQQNHPEGKKCDCIKELGIDRKTVSKYWHKTT